MTRYTFTERKKRDELRNGQLLIYFDEQEGTEILTDEEGEVIDTYPVWTYLRVKVAPTIKYPDLVNAMIRARYSQSEVEAIFRHKLAGIDEWAFAEFDTFAEACKTRAQEETINMI